MAGSTWAGRRRALAVLLCALAIVLAVFLVPRKPCKEVDAAQRKQWMELSRRLRNIDVVGVAHADELRRLADATGIPAHSVEMLVTAHQSLGRPIALSTNGGPDVKLQTFYLPLELPAEVRRALTAKLDAVCMCLESGDACGLDKEVRRLEEDLVEARILVR